MFLSLYQFAFKDWQMSLWLCILHLHCKLYLLYMFILYYELYAFICALGCTLLLFTDLLLNFTSLSQYLYCTLCNDNKVECNLI